MKAELYVQGHFWATIEIPGDGLLALLAAGMISHTEHRADELKRYLEHLAQVHCAISLRAKQPLRYHPADIDAP